MQLPANREKVLEDAASAIGEWVDSCQIFVTWQEDGETCSGTIGTGNSFATLALVREWLAATAMTVDVGDNNDNG